jgi:hypothetical protein
MSFIKSKEQEGKTGLTGGWYQWEGEDTRKGSRRVNMVEMSRTVV